eukprot:3647743-Rhodomonas_salina.1
MCIRDRCVYVCRCRRVGVSGCRVSGCARGTGEGEPGLAGLAARLGGAALRGLPQAHAGRDHAAARQSRRQHPRRAPRRLPAAPRHGRRRRGHGGGDGADGRGRERAQQAQ